MSDKPERDEVTGQGTTGHEWDGIKELDTPLPRWWLYTFYACIAVAAIYWVLMPAWPIGNGYTHGVLNFSDRRNVAADVRTLQQARAPMFRQLANATPADLASNPDLQQFARAAGESAFGDNCRTCHGAGGAGAPGYPNLADDVWLWGGSLADIEHTIRVGIRSDHPDARTSQMPAFGRDHLLTAQQVGDVTEHVIAISGAHTRIQADAAAASRGAVVYNEQCAVCHGPNGDGNRSVGAPSLRDDVWLYGGSREEIRRQVELGRGGVMPTWERRFDAGTIRALAFYVHEMGGGEPDAPAEGASVPASVGAGQTAPAPDPAPSAPH
jgi:cytochrome c oxidase cbb3-type subunit 3